MNLKTIIISNTEKIIISKNEVYLGKILKKDQYLYLLINDVANGY